MFAEGARNNLDGRNRSSSDGNGKQARWLEDSEYIIDSAGNKWQKIKNNVERTNANINYQSNREIKPSQFSQWDAKKPINFNPVTKYKSDIVCYNCGEPGHYKSNCMYDTKSRTNLAEKKLLEKQKEVEELVTFISSQNNDSEKEQRNKKNVISNENRSSSKERYTMDEVKSESIDKRYKEQLELQKNLVMDLSKQGYTRDISPKKRLINLIDIDEQDDSEFKALRKDYENKLQLVKEEIESKKQKIEYIKAIQYLNELDNELKNLEESKTPKKEGKELITENKKKNKKKVNDKKEKSEKNEKDVDEGNKDTEVISKPNAKIDSDDDTKNEEVDEIKDKVDDDSKYESIYNDLIDLIKNKKEVGKYKDPASWRYVRDYLNKITEKNNDGEAVIRYFCKKIGKKLSNDKNNNLEDLAKALLL